jgi:hypothetical protein
MNNYEDWAILVAKKLKGEGEVIAAIDKDELDDAAATDIFVRTVLKPFLPENFGIGAGRIVDAFGNRSDYLDIVIYNRSFPRIGLRGTQSDYLYESVLAAFTIRAKFVRKTFFESMDSCASMARLVTNVDKTVLIQLARRNGLKPGPNKTFIHEDPVRTARFELIGSPPTFMFGFSGIKTSYRQLQENIELWIEQRMEEKVDLPMRAFPAVIATQGCFAWRNAAPLALSSRQMLGIGNDHAPIRLIILQLLYLLNRRLNTSSDGYGLKPNLSAYLGQFSAPKFERGVGDVDRLVSLKLDSKSDTAADQGHRLQSARDHTTNAPGAVPGAESPVESPTKPAAESSVKQVAKTVQQAAASAAASSKPAPSTTKPAGKPATEAATSSGVFDKPSPFASAPAPAAPAESAKPAGKPATGAATSSGVFDKPSPFASAPAPAESARPAGKPATGATTSSGIFNKPSPFASAPAAPAEPASPARYKPPTASLGSAPIPAMASSPDDKPAEAPAAVPDKVESAPATEFESTMIMPPDPSRSSKPSSNSTEAFIERVKEQLSGSRTEKEEEPFISTIPQ